MFTPSNHIQNYWHVSAKNPAVIETFSKGKVASVDTCYLSDYITEEMDFICANDPIADAFEICVSAQAIIETCNVALKILTFRVTNKHLPPF